MSGCPKNEEGFYSAPIAASIREVGLVEPPVVARDRGEMGKFLLLDGHLRVDVLKDLGQTDVCCLISTDDEAYTYNNVSTGSQWSKSTG